MAELKRRRHGAVSTNTGGQMPGQHLLRPGVRATIRRPDYNKKTLPMVGHIVPPITTTDENGRKVKKHFEPYRDGHGMEGLMHWCVILDVAHGIGIGDDRKSFILCDPTDETANSVDDTPYGILYRRISRAVKSSAGTENRVICGKKKVSPKMWSDLLPNENTSYEAQAFIKPSRTRTGYVPMLLAVDEGKLALGKNGRLRGAAPGDMAQVVQLSGSAMETLRKQACKESAAFTPDNYNWDEVYEYGDFTKLDGSGKFVVIYNPSYHVTAGQITMKAKAGSTSVDADDYDPEAAAASGGGRGKSGFASYEIDLVPKVLLPRLDGPGLALDARYSEKVLFKDPAVAKDVLDNYDEIFKYFHLPSWEEQCLWIAQAYRSRAELLLYGWADNREYFTDEVNAILSARVQGMVPAASQVEDPDDDEPDEDVNSIYDDEDTDDDPLPVVSRKPDKTKAPKAMGKAGKATAAAMMYDDEDDDGPDGVMVDDEDDDISPFGIGDDDDDDIETTIAQADVDDDELEDIDEYGTEDEEEPELEDDDDEDSSMALILAAAKAKEEARRKAAKAAKAAQTKQPAAAPSAKPRLKKPSPTLADLEKLAAKAKAEAAAAAGKKRKRRIDGLPQE